MDFKRIQMMLILFFLIFDVYLGVRIFQEIQETVVRQSDYQQSSLEQRLSARGIVLNSPLDETAVEGVLVKTEDTQYLRTHAQDLSQDALDITLGDHGNLSATFKKPLDLEGKVTEQMTTLPTEVAKFIHNKYLVNEQLFIKGSQYTQYWYLPATRTIIFWMTAIDNIPIVDGSAEIRLQLDENYNIASYTQTYQTGFAVLDKAKPHRLISARDAVDVLDARIQTNLPSNSTIIHITLSYTKYKEWDEINIYLPVWNVVYQRSDGQTGSMLVDAIKGQVVERMTPPASSP
ncbi:two-component system regulatory protein YycI [Tuanshanicoccus lijuaniae]|uniref:two-component system regulatory protein YycI n=1 Tax=Aerococcaceae bacterium zg-1292 TaxID=2774330 RepID=UPI0019377795|nr:two-component system regulatory protein YycI [Aerococcaceae bacterium zg-1292]MBF6625227.1 two-component system regulatory protein YycI [Aerococcaceae bacterium zg-BR9]MBF6978354.1 two-component system regulatory protein YycI [Aerococcaceae bacterium zg-BR22]MBS4456967.1 two-component system regulatory protein YycI [Aerococcaceae bacterium zg-A91]MBS4458828.1 two-component system regulatory protein YycI [Aerococcaceae bacterium zg-BR33]